MDFYGKLVTVVRLLYLQSFFAIFLELMDFFGNFFDRVGYESALNQYF